MESLPAYMILFRRIISGVCRPLGERLQKRRQMPPFRGGPFTDPFNFSAMVIDHIQLDDVTVFRIDQVYS
jgi:hypothetical protein